MSLRILNYYLVLFCYRYLSTGMSFRALAFSFKMSHTTVRSIVYEVCDAIWEEFHAQHMPYPTSAMHETVAKDFFTKWNFPNCIGCIDGKHIRLRAPPNSGSMYWNYKHYHSIVLQAVADAHCKFLYIEVGSYGKQSDGGIFAGSSLKQCLENRQFCVPDERPIPNTDINTPYVLLGDEAYPLRTYLMRPYSGRGLTEQQEIYNYRLSRARRVVECAFGILSSKWRILRKEIECHPTKADKIVKCVCLLHNIVIDKESGFANSLQMNCEKLRPQHMDGIKRQNNRSTVEAYRVRDNFKDYFNSRIGSVPFQTI